MIRYKINYINITSPFGIRFLLHQTSQDQLNEFKEIYPEKYYPAVNRGIKSYESKTKQG